MKLNVQNLKKRPKLLIAVALVVICSIGAYAYYEHTVSASKAGAVETAEVTRMNIKSSISATGVISPVNSVEVSPKITARISTVAVKENAVSRKDRSSPPWTVKTMLQRKIRLNTN